MIGRIIHYFGTLLLFLAFILLIVTCVSAPAADELGLLKVRLHDRFPDRTPDITFGSFGYCINDILGNGQNYCSNTGVGYNAVDVLVGEIYYVRIDQGQARTTNGLTRAMVLHPIACILNFFAFLLALGSGIIGSLLGALAAGLAFIVTLVVLITDFVCFRRLHDAVNDYSAYSAATASYGPAIWTVVAAFVLSFVGMVLVFFTCCSGALSRRRDRDKVVYESRSPPRVDRADRRRWYGRARGGGGSDESYRSG